MRVECDTRKYHEFIAEYCLYECAAQVTIPKAMEAIPNGRLCQEHCFQVNYI